MDTLNELQDFSEDEDEDMSVAIGKYQIMEIPQFTPE